MSNILKENRSTNKKQHGRIVFVLPTKALVNQVAGNPNFNLKVIFTDVLGKSLQFLRGIRRMKTT
jgi:hypothetical protein